MDTKNRHRRCGFCGKMPLNGINILFIVLICVILYVFNHFEMKQYRAQKTQEKAQQQAKAQFEKLSDECFLHNNHQSCEILKTLQ
ncbi:hypothetical protein [Helicobacter equorum]|uniref:hypothetical protein n=1 Tax=Helicobacter equorum TaxID=361872 RepID=UPI000CF10E8B|nr:hypothetical protein [Helicobacter equorum]